MPPQTILREILDRKREEVARRRREVPLARLRAEAAQAPPPRDFVAALSGPNLALIAEVKRASPSKGLLRADFDPVDLARRYEANGAAAISVLTDGPFFGGSLEHLRAVRRRVRLPLLRKDFILDPYQVYEARAAGADALLLIVAALDDATLQALYRLTRRLGMAALVEVHDEAELARALRIGPRLIGVNNRDLRTFRVDLGTTARLRPQVPRGVLLVAESGIRGRSDAEGLAAAGADAILVGEALVRAADPGRKAREFTTPPIPHPPLRPRGSGQRGPRIKVCGLTTLEDARRAAEAGADFLGFVFYPRSPRFVRPERVAAITAALRAEFGADAPRFVGVFVDAPAEEVRAVLDAAGLDLAQLHGREPPALVEALHPRAFKALRPRSPEEAEAMAEVYRAALPDAATLPQLLVDAYHPIRPGGTGLRADWGIARELARRFRLLLAGGLTPENVGEAIVQVRPWGVDVSSGVERSKGLKDPAKLRAFVEAVRR